MPTTTRTPRRTNGTGPTDDTPVGPDVTAKVRPPRKPQDHKRPSAARAEVENIPVTFAWDGEDWIVVPSDAQQLEFLAALEDEELIKALRLLMGREQAARLIKGRNVNQLIDFFETMDQQVGLGNQ